MSSSIVGALYWIFGSGKQGHSFLSFRNSRGRFAQTCISAPKKHAFPPRQKNPARPFRADAENPAPLFGKSRAPPRNRRPAVDSNREKNIFRCCVVRRSVSLTSALRVSRWPQHNGAETSHGEHASRIELRIRKEWFRSAEIPIAKKASAFLEGTAFVGSHASTRSTVARASGKRRMPVGKREIVTR